MVCVYCGGKTQILNSRRQRRANQTWRRHHCLACDGTFTTVEGVDWERTIVVISNGNLEPFSRDKLFISIYKSCKHRKDATAAAAALTATVVSKLLPKIVDASLQRKDIIIVVSDVLGRFDKAAAVSYTAFHPL